jgi:hypothetical protein
MGSIPPAHLGRQSHQRCAIVCSLDTVQVVRQEVEEVPLQDLDRAAGIAGESATLLMFDLQIVLPKERLDRQPADLHSKYPVAVTGQPEHVEALAAERNEDPRSGGEPERRMVSLEPGVDLLLMKACPVLLPSFYPEIRFHTDCNRELR